MGQAALPVALIGSSLLGGIFAPEGQELSSFENTAVDPTNTLAFAQQGLRHALGDAQALASQPVELQTTVAPTPIFAGGGLPMTIGAPAQDPARRNPERRRLGSTSTIDPTPRGPDFNTRRGLPDRGGQGWDVMTTGPSFGSGSGMSGDFDQAIGGVELLRSQLAGMSFGSGGRPRG